MQQGHKKGGNSNGSCRMTFKTLIRPYYKTMAVVLLCLSLSNALSLAFPWGVKVLIDDVLVGQNVELLNIIILTLSGILVLRFIFNFLRTYKSNLIGEQLVQDVRRNMYAHIQRLSLTSIGQISPAQILVRITQDVDSMRRFLFRDGMEFIYSLFSFVFIVVILLCLSPKLTLISLVALPFFGLFYLQLKPKLENRHLQYREECGNLSSRINEMLSGIHVVRAFKREKYEIDKLDYQQKAIYKTAAQAHYLNSWLIAGMESITSLGIVAILWMGAKDALANTITAGELVAIYTYLGMLFMPLMRVIGINASYQEAFAAMKRINDVMGINDQITENRIPFKLSNLAGSIEFKQVNFSYVKEQPILNDINFIVEPGQTLGIVGASGAGKTTLVNLLLRFFDPDSGILRMDGHDLRCLDLESYRQQVAVVLQDDFLFNGTIEANIRYGRLDASKEDIRLAAHIAQADAFIANLANKYDTQVGERGLNLSCGQRQRIAIARALVRKPSILILDEATSAVDALTENAIQQSIHYFMRERTVVTIAHRFSTIIECDKIIVLDQGKIVEMGSHNYLLNQRGFYNNLYCEQFKTEDRIALENI